MYLNDYVYVVQVRIQDNGIVTISRQIGSAEHSLS